jgi:transcriptional antiterminator RfaH
MSDAVQWFLAYSKPRGERVAEENLLRQGYECVLPWLTVSKRRRGRWIWEDEPLFPRYVFVGAHEGQSWSPVQSTLGVASLVRVGSRIVSVPTALVEGLRAVAEAGPERQLRFKQGQRVYITGESFSSIAGVFEMEDGENRARVLIDLLGRPTVVRVSMAQLTADG